MKIYKLLIVVIINPANLLAQTYTGKDTFDKVRAIVISKSNVVAIGSQYEAEVLLVNVNSKSANPVYVNGRPLPMRDGKGIYSARPSNVGNFVFGGKIEVRENGKTNSYPFSDEYQVIQAFANIQADAMNLLYIGVNNPVSISVTGHSPNDIVATITNGILRKTATGYIAQVTQKGQAVISVAVKMEDGSTRMMGASSFRVKEIPIPGSMFGVLESGVYPKAAIEAQTFINTQTTNFSLEGIKWKVLKYSYSFFPVNGKPEFYEVSESAISNEIKESIKKAQSGDKIVIDQISAEGPSGIIKVPPIVLTVGN